MTTKPPTTAGIDTEPDERAELAAATAEPAPDQARPRPGDWLVAAGPPPQASGAEPATPGLPKLAAGEPGESPEELWQHVRRFHAGDPAAAKALPAPGAGFLPALLHPLRDPRRVRHDYPLVLLAEGDDDEPTALPLSDFLAGTLDRVAAGPDDARVLRDNLARLERQTRHCLEGVDAASPAATVLTRAAQAMEEALNLRGDSGRALHDDLARLLEAVPDDAMLLDLGERTPLRVFLHVARRRAAARRAALRKQVAATASRLHDLLRLDDVKQEGADRTASVAATVGETGDQHLDADALARLLRRSRGSSPMDPARRSRVERVAATLDAFRSRQEPLVHVVLPKDQADEPTTDEIAWHRVKKAGVGRVAAEAFDEIASAYADLFAALRVARLELDGAYDPARHDALKDMFDWRSFSREELLELPPVLALESAAHVAGEGMPELSKLLLSSRPINVLVEVDPAANPGDPSAREPLGGYRFELGYLGMSHREAMVHQTSAARPRHLLEGFAGSLDAACASLHVVATERTVPDSEAPVWTWLHVATALEGRAHPFFHYNPEVGDTWARRLDFVENPQPEADWPAYDLAFVDAGGAEATMPVAFTFADFALLDPAYRAHFCVLPAALASEDLVTVPEFLSGSGDLPLDQVPYVWAVDDAGHLHRLAISRALAFACRDRLAYWHTLQELAGVRNEYVRAAVAREQERLESEFAERQSRADEEHTAQVEQVREDAARDAMRALARALLQRDAGALAAAASAVAAPVTTAPATVAEPEAAPPAEAVEPEPAAPEPEPEEAEEPWIESALCTSCNDCLQINPRLFVYNANKQAVIGDPKSGTYDELVRAAEKCPARCIHPGTPLNPDEANLDELIERAKPFR